MNKTIRGVAALVGISVAIANFSAFARVNTTTVHIGDLSLSLTTATPVARSAVPEYGTFYLLSDYIKCEGSPPPYPFDPLPDSLAYLLAAPDVFVIDDLTGSAQASGMAGAQQMTSDDLAPPDDPGDETDPGTNAPPINWPVSLADLQLAQGVPEFGTFYLYQDQLTGDPPDPPPYPSIPDLFSQCPVYSLDTNNTLFLVDDSNVTRPDPPAQPPYTSQSYAPGAFYLELTNFSNGFATLVVHGVVPGGSYEILSCQSPAGGAWNSEKLFVADQDPTLLSIPVSNRGNSLFFWAHSQSALWLEMPANSLSTPGVMTAILHNTSPGQNYLLCTKQTLSDAQWSVEQTVAGAAGNATTVQLATSNRPSLFVRAKLQTTAIPDFAIDITGYSFSGPTFIPIDFMGYDIGQVANIDVLISGDAIPHCVFTYAVVAGQTNWGAGIYFDRIPNGNYQIQLTSTIHLNDQIDDAQYAVLTNVTRSIVVDNQVTFTNWDDIVWNNTSYTFRAQTQFADADWWIDIYDAWGYFINEGSGHTSDGQITWTWDLTDFDGYLRNDLDTDPFFDPWITVNPTSAAAGNNLSSAAQGPSPTPIVALSYPSIGCWLISYQNEFYESGTPGYDYLVAAMQAIANWVDYRYVPFTYLPIAYGTNDWTQQERDGDWVTTLSALSHPDYRNFYYFGHGAQNTIGGDVNVYSNGVLTGSAYLPNSKAYLTSKMVKDKATANKNTGAHPYRFVLLDACNTAQGGWSDAFGMDNAIHDIAYYRSSHKRPAAFAGWTVKNGGPGWGLVDAQCYFRSQWMFRWSYYWMTETIVDAFNDAGRDASWPPGPGPALSKGLTVYGYNALKMNEYNAMNDWSGQ